ncbi:hypothetical protein J3R83DRAFT_5454 [Lanmaoa asiatica]|nr:hypothetical protein J3R83DRAFT_5454 [Lanmaoa asiatica]
MRPKTETGYAEATDHLENAGPKGVGQEGTLERLAERTACVRERGDDGYEAGDSFRDHTMGCCPEAIQRERAASRREDEVATAHERAVAMREKGTTTMDTFQQLAKQRFG